MCAALVVMAGCTRKHYYIRADRESYRTLEEETASTPWEPPPGFSIFPHRGARFFDPTSPVDPLLPIPSPQLYAYRLPEIPSRDPARFRPEVTPGQPGGPVDGYDGMDGGTDRPDRPDEGLALVAWQEEGPPGPGPDSRGPADALYPDTDEDGALRVQPVPKDVWESIPASCLRRMFEFRSVREEYRSSYGRAPPEGLRDPSQRLALEDIIKLALVNSREYQTAKETLYTAALVLTFQRFRFDLKFTPLNNGSDVDYTHSRTGGNTVNTLRVPTEFNADKILASGGDILARFANNVVLTFNGPDGFAMDVGSELLFDISQTVFQRDMLFEPLTQAERDLVYAARDFARFRKTFFRDLAFQYYTLINRYRNIAIRSQDYFSNLRAFLQQEAEERVGRRSRIQVDQIEQQVLASRSNLIATCNALESGLDNLKLAIGIPPELPINLDLTELEELTLRDEATVRAELVRRARRNLQQERDEEEPERTTLLNASIRLIERLLGLQELRARLGQDDTDRSALEDLLAAMRVDEAEEIVDLNRQVLAERKRAVPPVPPELIFERTTALIRSLFTLIRRQLNLAIRQEVDPDRVSDVARKLSALERRLEQVRADLARAVRERALDRIPGLVRSAEGLLADTDALARTAAGLLRRPRLTPEEQRRQTLEQVEYLLSESAEALAEGVGGLVPVEIDMDDALLTALVLRFDLMNQRGVLADVWRRIKLAGDDLRSILNLNASQVIRTEKNRPFGFTFDESESQLSLSFDAPLNRKAQRNAFRQSLIDYQVALRNLIGLEDTIKVAVRDDLRALQLDREQYRIAVASAALASDRVASTRLQLQLGTEGVSARDFVEAQRAYTTSLSDVAGQHIGYIQDRISLFLDLELLYVDDEGFWPKLYAEQYQPEPAYELPPYPPYGRLPGWVWYSHKVKRMLHVPRGSTVIYKQEETPSSEREPPAERIPIPPKEVEPEADGPPQLGEADRPGP